MPVHVERMSTERCSASVSLFPMHPTRCIYLSMLMFLLMSLCTAQQPNESHTPVDKELRAILVNYYNALEHQNPHTPNHPGEQGVPTMVEEHEMEEEESITDITIEYIKNHIQTRILSGLFAARKDTPRQSIIPPSQLGGYILGDPARENKGIYPRTDQQVVVDQVFTASGFVLSAAVLAIFSFSCIYCWCISSPARLIGAISTILAVFLLFHRLHEFFIVFSVDQLSDAAKSIMPNLHIE